MYKVEFKAEFAYASKEQEGEYFLVGLAEHQYDYEKYIIFQKSYNLSEDDNPEADHNGIYVECNGDSCFNCCKSISISNTEVKLFVSDTEIIIDIENLIIPPSFIEYLRNIFGDLLELNK